MQRFLPHRFELTSVSGTLPVTEIYRDCYPAVGDQLVIFNYPHVEAYAIERFDPRPEHWEHDHFEPVAIALRLIEVVQTASPASNVVALDGGGDLPHRLANVARVARQSITDGIALDICHADFVLLCEAGNLPSDVAGYDAFAYQRIPATVGETDARWNVSTCFTGYSDDRHVLYVTLPGGAPFVMNIHFLALASTYCEGRLPASQLLTRAVKIAMNAGTVVDEAISHALVNGTDLLIEGLMPPYDAAQELTRILMPSESARIRSIWEAHVRRISAPPPTRQSMLDLSPQAVFSASPKAPANQA